MRYVGRSDLGGRPSRHLEKFHHGGTEGTETARRKRVINSTPTKSVLLPSPPPPQTALADVQSAGWSRCDSHRPRLIPGFGRVARQSEPA